MTKPFSFLILFFCLHIGFAQDVHLSQYYTNNMSLNPAFTGFYDGDLRFTGNYRSQWGQVGVPINTNMFSMEKHIDKYAHSFGVGILFINDRVSSYALNTNKIMLGLSYERTFADIVFRIGGQGGYVMRSSDLSGQTFPGQWNYSTGQFDETMSSGEAASTYNHGYVDVSTGLAAMKKFNSRINVTAGYGLFHLNKAKEEVFVEETFIPFRHVFTLQGALKNRNGLYIFQPRYLYMYSSGAVDMVTGINAKRKINTDLWFMLGMHFRSTVAQNDAVIAILGATYKRFDVGFSMDFNVSKLSQDGPYKSTYEISVIYTTPRIAPDKIALPCDRY